MAAELIERAGVRACCGGTSINLQNINGRTLQIATLSNKLIIGFNAGVNAGNTRCYRLLRAARFYFPGANAKWQIEYVVPGSCR